MNLLREKGLAPSRVVDVQVDSVLWLDQRGKPKTTFVRATSERGAIVTRVATVDGFEP